LWGTGVTPAVTADPESADLELGVKFQSDVSGWVTKLRFYKGSTNTGPHTGSLWTSDGTLLANALYFGETASGWQEVTLATPAAIAANTTYVASYHATVGHYAVDNGYFATSGVNNSPLRAPATGAIGGNGVFRSGAGFPTQTYNGNNYWVDVEFSTTPPPPPPPQCPCSLWGSGATPVVTADPESADLELGVKFQSDVSGWVTKLRFYKGSTNTGPHTGSLWASDGTLLASALYIGETASGWQEVTLATPVAIAANTTYVVSYHTTVGHFAVDSGYFATSGVNNSPLRAPATGAVGGNGVFRSGAGFPALTYNGNNYWVDVVFSTTPPQSP